MLFIWPSKDKALAHNLKCIIPSAMRIYSEWDEPDSLGESVDRALYLAIFSSSPILRDRDSNLVLALRVLHSASSDVNEHGCLIVGIVHTDVSLRAFQLSALRNLTGESSDTGLMNYLSCGVGSGLRPKLSLNSAVMARI